MTIQPIKKLLVANRGEIAIRVFRAASELHIRTVALYTHEDRYSLHRYKADEAYCIGSKDEALKPYLDIEAIVACAKEVGADAIHPGYGFLSENPDFVRACDEAGILFVGPPAAIIDAVGDKVKAKQLARSLNIPTIEGSADPVSDIDEAKKWASSIGYPVLIKAASGGGGRGMRVAYNDKELEKLFVEAGKEALRAFSDERVFIERYVANPKHIEVQIIADAHGEVLHLFERDCSVQRRFQKVIEVAPAFSISNDAKQKLYDAAVSLARGAGYRNAGTVEFLVDEHENIFFIEVNPRIQVEHTVTEEITGIDIVRTQLKIAEGYALASEELGSLTQDTVRYRGAAIQCRITTEVPKNDFAPDYGKLLAYRSPGGFGIRLDAGSAYSGAVISPYFDSLLVKVTAQGNTLAGAARRLERALREFRVRGVEHNIPFLINVLRHPTFLESEVHVNFLKETPEVFEFREPRNRVTKLLHYLADVTINGNPDIGVLSFKGNKSTPPLPKLTTATKQGTRERFLEIGREAFVKEVKADKKVFYTDTTFRDAHQSLIATRVRTADLLEIAPFYEAVKGELFSLEMWGGATFDVCMRFLHECPWERLRALRKAIPHTLFQMLLRGSNAVGYTAYHDKLVIAFIEQAAEEGIDVFRIFDSMNWIESMQESIKAVCERTSAIAEACICYTGDILDKNRKKYTIQYYIDRARELEDAGAHILAIKDMAGLLTAEAAPVLIEALQGAVSIPIHLHTHDTSSLQSGMYKEAVSAGVDIIDVAVSSMSGLTSQPNFNTLLQLLKNHERYREINAEFLQDVSDYFEVVRELYFPFESGLKAGTADVYVHEIPGGQYSNLLRQARSLGLQHEFPLVKKNYTTANQLLGDLVKVTPSSKVVGDLALFMTSHGLTGKDIEEKASELSFPESLKGFFKGDIGQPYQGFPKKLQEAVLKGEKPYTGRANEHMPEPDIEKEHTEFVKEHPCTHSFAEYLSSKLYPKVYSEYIEFRELNGPVEVLPSSVFFYGIEVGEEFSFELEVGKTVFVELEYITDATSEGLRSLGFKVNGQLRVIDILDKSLNVERVSYRKVSEALHVGAGLQGKLSQVMVQAGEKIKKDQALFVIEAMKMETVVTATQDGVIGEVVRQSGDLVAADDLIVVFE